MGETNKYRAVQRALSGSKWEALSQLMVRGTWSVDDMVIYGIVWGDKIDEVMRSPDPPQEIDTFHRATLRAVKKRGYGRQQPGDGGQRKYLVPQAEARRIVETDLARRFALSPEKRLLASLTPDDGGTHDFGEEGRKPQSYDPASKLDVAVLTALMSTLISLVDERHRVPDVAALRRDLANLDDLGAAIDFDDLPPGREDEVAHYLVALVDKLEEPDSYLRSPRRETDPLPDSRSTDFQRRVEGILRDSGSIGDLVGRFIPGKDPYPTHPGWNGPGAG